MSCGNWIIGRPIQEKLYEYLCTDAFESQVKESFRKFLSLARKFMCSLLSSSNVFILNSVEIPLVLVVISLLGFRLRSDYLLYFL